MNSQPQPNTPAAAADGQGAGEAKPTTVAATAGEPTPATGKRQALRDLRRQLTNEDLASPGVHKMLLDELERADADCELLNGYRTRFHDVDKRAAVLEERVRTQTALEVMFGVGVGLGGAIMGFAPSLWPSPPFGYIALGLGFLLVLGATIARVIKR